MVMEQLVKRRRKLSPVKMEYSRLMDDSVLKALGKHLGLKPAQIYHSEAPLDLSFFSKIRDLLYTHKDLFYEKQVPGIPGSIERNQSMLGQIEEKRQVFVFPL